MKEFSYWDIKNYLISNEMTLSKINNGYKSNRYIKYTEYQIIDSKTGKIICSRITLISIEKWLKKIGVTKEII